MHSKIDVPKKVKATYNLERMRLIQSGGKPFLP